MPSWTDLIQFRMGKKPGFVVEGGEVKKVFGPSYELLRTRDVAAAPLFFDRRLAEEHAARQRQLAGARS